MTYLCSFLRQVTEEVLSVLRLLHPLTDTESSPSEPSKGGNCLDAALAQLQDVARKLAISHTKEVKAAPQHSNKVCHPQHFPVVQRNVSLKHTL